MSKDFDRKVFSYLLKGPIEFNNVQRIVDFSILLDAIHFDYKPLGKIVQEYYNQYRMPPTINLLKDSLVQEFEVLEIVLELEDEVCQESEVKYYVDQIRKRYNAYLARSLGDIISDDPEKFDQEEFNTSLGRIQSKISRLYKSAVFTEGSIQSSTDERYGRYVYTEENPEQITGIFSGYKELDNYTWGIKKAELLVISGASSSGKSLLMMNIGINAWLGTTDPLSDYMCKDGKNVLFFSLEMNKEQIENRLDANLASVPINNIVRGKLTYEEKQKYKKILQFCREYDKQFYICDMPRGTRMIDIEARYEVICSEFKPDLVCIDYLGIMKPNNASKNQDWLDVGYVAEEMAEFARSKNIPTVTAAQRKAKDKKAKKQYQDNEEIGRSKLIGDNANIHFLIEDRDEEYLREDMVIHIAKNRDGAKGKVTLLKDFEKAKIANTPDDWIGDSGDENAV